MAWRLALAPGVDDEAAVAATDGEAPGLYAEAGDLALFEDVLQLREVVDAPDEFPLDVPPKHTNKPIASGSRSQNVTQSLRRMCGG